MSQRICAGGARESRRSYGGQAVIEGVMMKGRTSVTLAVRTPAGHIVVETDTIRPLRLDERLMRIPVLRGALALAETVLLGIRAIFRSVDLASQRGNEAGASPQGEDASSAHRIWMFPVAGSAIAAAVALFVVLPAVGAAVLSRYTGISGKLALNFVETAIRVAVLVTYVAAISGMKDIRRILEYHGAEHKVVWAWETLDDDVREILRDPVETSRLLSRRAGEMSRLHPRCGTSFLFLTVLVSALVFSLASPGELLLRTLLRVALLPVVGGLSYELLKVAPGRSGPVLAVVRAPGLALQKLTTREPDDDEIEVASMALAHLLLREELRGDGTGPAG